MIGRADIEESKSNVAMNAWLPQASYPYGNFSDTSNKKISYFGGKVRVGCEGWLFAITHTHPHPSTPSSPPTTLSFTFKGSIGHAFTVCIHTENQNQGSFYPFILREISVLAELPLGHLCYLLKGIPPQSNSPPEAVMGWGCEYIINIFI